jgi:hypothetical protein
MTVIRPNSIAGITSITAQGENISFYSSDGVNISQFNANINASSGISTIANLNVTGVVTAGNGVRGVGIYSGNNAITTGIITALNFVGAGNTFAVVGNRVDISIAGGAGGGASNELDFMLFG